MLLKLSKYELLALRKLSQNSMGAGLLAKNLGVKSSFMARILGSLTEKALISTEKTGSAKMVSLSIASHAQKLKELFLARPQARPEEWLSGHALEILAIMSGNEGVSRKTLESDCACSKPTLYKVIKSLQGAGVMNCDKMACRITDQSIKYFADAFADNIQRMEQRQLKGDKVSVRVGKNVVLRTASWQAPKHMALTGMSVLAETGLKTIKTAYSDYYFNLDGRERELSTEESFVHALLLTTQASIRPFPERPLLAIYMKKGKMDSGKLREFASKYAVAQQLEEIIKAISYHEKLGEYE